MEKLQYDNFDDYHDNIRISYKECNNEKGLQLAMELKDALEKHFISNTLKSLWVCYVNLSIGYERLHNFKAAKYYIKLAFKYTNDISEYLKTKTQLAICYQESNENKKALSIYNYCINICNERLFFLNDPYVKKENKNNLLECKAGLLRNKGELLDNELLIYQAIKIYKKIYKDLYYLDRFKSQIIKNKIKKSYEEINKIHNK